MALRAPPHRHAAAARRARARRSAPRTPTRASRVPRAVSREDGDRDRGERFVEAAPKEASAKASRRDEKKTALSRAVLKTALALTACAAPHVVPLVASPGTSRAGVSACRHFAASAADRTATGEGAPAETRPASSETETETEPKRKPEAGVDYPFLSSRDVSSRELDFRNWLADVRLECARRGVRDATIAACFDGLEPYPEPEPAPAPAPAPATPEDEARARLAREKSEAAARKASEHKVRKYISNMVSRDRVERGASLLLKHAGILGEVEREYGVPGEIIVAIWGIESSFGGFSGNTDCVEALANIAWSRGVSGDVTDAAYFRNELIEATRIVDKGLGVNTTETGENTKEPDGSNAFRVFKRRVALVGSWDGGLGQCQFMPSNYHVYAVDKDGDGAADIWNSLPDVFASMGNFISKYCEWDKSVRAAGFVATFENDASLKKLAAADAIGGFWAERRAWRPAKFFAWNGLRTTHREHAPVPSSESTLLMPDGAESSSSLAFLATANFRALMRYNPSTQYAMAVSTLAQEIVDEAAEITARRAREEKAREAEKVKAAEATKKGKSSLPQTSQKKTDDA